MPLPSATKPTRRSAFLIFVGDRFPEVRSQPGLMRKSKDGKDVVDLPKVTTSLGQEWKSMSETAKAVSSTLERPRFSFIEQAY